MRNGTLLYAQSGGVTAVINATAAAVIEQARAKGIKVLAGAATPPMKVPAIARICTLLMTEDCDR